jgi:2-dehydro-3-deoxyphosphogluconate aldolase/(4S)-4-hydroxy-2-oxoglutarate aldolase
MPEIERLSPAEEEFLDLARRDGLVAVIRAEHIADPGRLVEVLVAGGIRCIEFTLTTTGALDAVEQTADRGAMVGVGTILEEGQARDAIAAGAAFLVSPALRGGLVQPAKDAGLPVILGAFTPTEVVEGMQLGATALKLFPAHVGGPSYVKDLLGPLPGARLIPSGGIGPEDVPTFLDAGAVAVYAGSALAPANAVESGDLVEIARRAEAFTSRLRRPA